MIMPMKIWLPYVRGGSGSDVFTRYLAKGLQELGHETVSQAFADHWQYFPWALRRAPAPEGTQVVLSNTWNGFAFKRTGAPLVTVEHLFVLDPAYRPYKSSAQAAFHATLVKRFERASMRLSDAQVAVSDYTAEAHRLGLGGPRPLTILNGVDTDFFTPATKQVTSTEGPTRLLFVGNLTRRKGADLLPAIMARLGEGYSLEYTSGLRTDDFLAEIPNARALGRLDHDQVREAYRRADLLLFPTRLEGLPLVAMEAMACGTPVIASDTASLPEVITHDVTGALCRKDDADDFVAAIRRLTADADKRRTMGQAAREAAVARFSLDRMTRDYIALLEDLVRRESQGARGH